MSDSDSSDGILDVIAKKSRTETELAPVNSGATPRDNPRDNSRATPRAKSRPSPRVTPRATKSANPPLSPDEVYIPPVFLAHGPRNSRLLKKSKEIALQIEQDAKRTASQIEQLDNLKKAFLREINDNGSHVTFNLKNATPMIEKYVQMHHTNEAGLHLQRHFYCFNDVYRLELPFSEKTAEVLLSVVNGDRTCPSEVGRNLAKSGIPEVEAVRFFLSRCYTEDELRFGITVLQHATLGNGFHDLFSALGSYPEHELPLKLIHYNGHPALTVLRLRLVFQTGLSCIDEKEQLRYFFIACLDYVLNKEARQMLRDEFIRPIFPLLPQLGLLWTETLIAVETRTPDVHPYTNFKEAELTANFIDHVHELFPELPVVRELERFFLTGEQHQSGPMAAEELISVVARVGAEISETEAYLRGFQAQLACKKLVAAVYGPTPGKQQWMPRLQKALQRAKDQLQERLGHVLRGSGAGKHVLTLALSDTYHEFDWLSHAVDKTLVYHEGDIFYGT